VGGTIGESNYINLFDLDGVLINSFIKGDIHPRSSELAKGSIIATNRSGSIDNVRPWNTESKLAVLRSHYGFEQIFVGLDKANPRDRFTPRNKQQYQALIEIIISRINNTEGEIAIQYVVDTVGWRAPFQKILGMKDKYFLDRISQSLVENNIDLSRIKFKMVVVGSILNDIEDFLGKMNDFYNNMFPTES